MNLLVSSFFSWWSLSCVIDFLDWLEAAMSGKVPLFRTQTQSVMVCCLSGARRSVTHQTGLLLKHSPQSSSLLLRFHFEKDSQFKWIELKPVRVGNFPLRFSLWSAKSLLWMSVFTLIESTITIAKNFALGLVLENSAMVYSKCLFLIWHCKRF